MSRSRIDSPAPTVAIVGGGLAGLSCALSLGGAGFQVTVYEARAHLGGKAGARPPTPDERSPVPVEHGPHFMAGWYLNLRSLMDRLGVTDHLVDYDGYSVLGPATRADLPGPVSPALLSAASTTRLIQGYAANLRNGVLRWPLALKAASFALDLLTLQGGEQLDLLSVDALIRSRRYGDERLAEEAHQQILRAVSVPGELASVFSVRQMMALWFRYPRPFLSVLDTDLASGLIDPLARVVQQVAEIRTHAHVEGLLASDGELRGLRLADGPVVEADVLVAAVPVEVLRRWREPAPEQVDRRLQGLERLQVAPMASFLLGFDRALAGVPAGVVHLSDCEPAINLIDLRQTWHALQSSRETLLSVVISDYERLRDLSDAQAIEHILAELTRHLPDVRAAQLRTAIALPNFDAPFFVNTIGSWADRPDPLVAYGATAETCLHIVGDYVKTPVNLTCMEGAVLSGLLAAEEIAHRCGRAGSIRPHMPDIDGRARLAAYRFAKHAIAPLTAFAKLTPTRTGAA